MRVNVVTMGNIRLVATRRAAADVGTVVDFRTLDGDLAASVPAQQLRSRQRFLEVKHGRPEWDLGPVDTALVRRLLPPAS